MNIVQQARCERPKIVFQILYLRTAGSANASYSLGDDLWYLTTLTTLRMYIKLVTTDVMKSIIMIVSKM